MLKYLFILYLLDITNINMNILPDTLKAEYDDSTFKSDSTVTYKLNYLYYDKNIGITNIFIQRPCFIDYVDLYIDYKYIERKYLNINKSKDDINIEFNYLKQNKIIECYTPETKIINNKKINITDSKTVYIKIKYKSFTEDIISLPKVGFDIKEIQSKQKYINNNKNMMQQHVFNIVNKYNHNNS